MKKIEYAKTYNKIIVAALMIVGMVYPLILNKKYYVNNINIMLITIIGIIAIYRINFKSKYTFSIDIMQWFFIYFFFCIAPLYQLSKATMPWGLKYTEKDIFVTNTIIIVWIIIYMMSYDLMLKRDSKIKIINVLNLKNNNLFIIFLSILTSLLFIYLIGVNNIFSRNELSDRAFSKYLSSITVLVTVFLRAFPVACFTCLYYKYKLEGRYNYLTITILFILLLLTNFPTGAARFWAGAIYIGLLCILSSKIKQSEIFKYVVIVSILIIFPIINFFRFYKLNEFSLSKLLYRDIFDMSIFFQGDFDAYSMLIRSIRYIESFGITFGKQLLGALLFFIPRNFWPNKPMGSGALIAKGQNLYYNNLSCPIIAESYLNFGFIGVILFSAVIGILIAYLDRKYWTLINNKKLIQKSTEFIIVIYPYLLGFSFFIYRGALIASFAYTMGFTMAMFIVHKFTFNTGEVTRLSYKSVSLSFNKNANL